MYESVKRILDKSKETGEDVLAARDMCIAEDRDNEDALRSASELIAAHYFTIAGLRRVSDEASIKKLCELVASGDKLALREFKEEIEER